MKLSLACLIPTLLLALPAAAAENHVLYCSPSAHCMVNLPAGEELLDILIADAGAWIQETGSYSSPPRHWVAIRPNSPCPDLSTRATFVTTERIVNFELRADCLGREPTDLDLEPVRASFRAAGLGKLPTVPALDTAFVVEHEGHVTAARVPSVVADDNRLYITWPKRPRRLPRLTLRDASGKALTVPNPHYDPERATLTVDHVLEPGESVELAYSKSRKVLITRPR